MVIFLTGPSGVGKSTLRDHYCKTRGVQPVSAYTTRQHRPGETEIHRCIDRASFEAMLNAGELCLVAQNHGEMYGYAISELLNPQSNSCIIEVDSSTAISEAEKLGAIIVRVVPGNVELAVQSIHRKRNMIQDRIDDLTNQVRPDFVKYRRISGDVVFVNYYDPESLSKFVELLDSVTGGANEK